MYDSRNVPCLKLFTNTSCALLGEWTILTGLITLCDCANWKQDGSVKIVSLRHDSTLRCRSDTCCMFQFRGAIGKPMSGATVYNVNLMSAYVSPPNMLTLTEGRDNAASVYRFRQWQGNLCLPCAW